MSSTRKLFKVVLSIFIKVIELRVGIEGIPHLRHFECVPDLAKEGVGSNTYGITISNLDCILTAIPYRVDLINTIDSLLGLTHCTSNFLYFVHMKQVSLTIWLQTTHQLVVNSLIENSSKDLADVLASKIFTHQSPWNHHSFIHAANTNFLVAYVYH